jgi:hypothetical protein
MMSASSQFKDCNCFAVGSASRHVTQLYDQFLTPVGLHVTQFCNRGCATSDMGQTRLR